MSQDETGAQQRAIEAYWTVASERVDINGLDWYMGQGSVGAVTPPAWSFGEDGDELLELVLAGKKTATSSALASYEATGEGVPESGDLSIVLDSLGRPRALIATREVSICAFSEVGEDHAEREGEGDGSLEEWQQAHREFFTKELAQIGEEFTSQMKVVLENFEVLDPRR